MIAIHETDSSDKVVQPFVDAAHRLWNYLVDTAASRAKVTEGLLIDAAGNLAEFLLHFAGGLLRTALVTGTTVLASGVKTYGPVVLAGIEREAQRAGAFLVRLGDRAVTLAAEYGPQLGRWTETQLRLLGEELVALLVKGKETTQKVIRQAVASR